MALQRESVDLVKLVSGHTITVSKDITAINWVYDDASIPNKDSALSYVEITLADLEDGDGVRYQVIPRTMVLWLILPSTYSPAV